MSLYEGTVRSRHVNIFLYLSFFLRYFGKMDESFEHLRFGQAFIVTFCKDKGVIDPELFYSTDNIKSNQIILDNYILD